MRHPRLGFLPVFFATLTVAFAIAVFVRIRSYRDDPAPRIPTPAVENTAAPVPLAEETGTIVDEPVPARPGTATTTASGPELQQRPPLLTSTPRASAPAPVAASDKQSLLTRVANAIMPARPATPAQTQPQQKQPQPKEPRQTPSESRSSSSSSEGDTTPSTTDTNPTIDETDRTSDSRAPQLAAIEFVPPEVEDGQETMLIVTAMDDLTGVQSISGTIVAPSGAIQGFACQRDGETNRYLSRVTVPREAAEGTWRVNYLSLVDKASNAASLTAQQGTVPPTAMFRVTSSRPDTEGPTLRAIWIDRRAMRGGEKNTVFVDAADEKSGVNLVTGVFQSPSKFARVGFICKQGSTWTCEFNAPTCADCGDWQLEQIQLQDKANNMTTLRGTNELVAAIRLDISSESCDATPPALENVVLDKNSVSNAADSAILLVATLSDDACGVLSVSGQAVGPTTSGPPPRRYFSLTAAGDPRTWRGSITIPRMAAKGLWRVSFVQVLDRGHNLKTYGAGDPVLAQASFTVQ